MDAHEPPSSIEAVVKAISKLSSDIEYLERGIRTLATRLRLSDQERFEPAPWDQEIQKLLIQNMPKSLPAALIAMENARTHIRGAELHLNAIRSGISASHPPWTVDAHVSI